MLKLKDLSQFYLQASYYHNYKKVGCLKCACTGKDFFNLSRNQSRLAAMPRIKGIPNTLANEDK